MNRRHDLICQDASLSVRVCVCVWWTSPVFVCGQTDWLTVTSPRCRSPSLNNSCSNAANLQSQGGTTETASVVILWGAAAWEPLRYTAQQHTQHVRPCIFTPPPPRLILTDLNVLNAAVRHRKWLKSHAAATGRPVNHCFCFSAQLLQVKRKKEPKYMCFNVYKKNKIKLIKLKLKCWI